MDDDDINEILAADEAAAAEAEADDDEEEQEDGIPCPNCGVMMPSDHGSQMCGQCQRNMSAPMWRF